MRNRAAVWVLLLFLGGGCSSKDRSTEMTETASDEPVGQNPQKSQKKSSQAQTQLTAAQDAVKKGEVDKAAAQLIQIQVSTPNFSPQDAAKYREVMGDAYSQALEAAAKGDPRGIEAVRMIRAASPH